MADRFTHLQQRLEEIDRKLSKYLGQSASPEQVELLRQRRETVLEMADERRALWGD